MKFRHILLIFCCLLILYLSCISYRSIFISNNVSQRRTNFILLGTDYVDNAIHADTIIFLSYLPSERILDIISIPRDTYVDVPNIKYKKITEVYAYLFLKNKKNRYKAAEEFIKVLEEKLFCVDDKQLKISYFFVIDYKNFIKFIDTLGKIKITVDKPMHYDDYAGKLHIHFEPGIYCMNGEDALKYVRFRDSAGDIGRLMRQQQFIKSVVSRMLNVDVVYKIPKLILRFKECFTTNMNFLEVLNMFLEFKNLRFTSLRFSILPYTPKGRYIEIDRVSLGKFIDFLNSNREISSDREITRNNKRVVIKLYNASNKPKLAKQVAYFLRDKGYDVLDWSNWYCKLPKSKIIDYSNNIKSLNEICNLLNIFDINTFYGKDVSTEEQIDFAIILGEDFVLK